MPLMRAAVIVAAPGNLLARILGEFDSATIIRVGPVR